MFTNYSEHAAVWDWDGYDNTPEYEYWCNYAKNYGSKVLSPMCALGQTGAYMARHGFLVTAFDYTPEMIDEGKKRFGAIKNLNYMVADICDFSFEESSFDFAFTVDLECLDSLDKIKSAVVCLGKHMRKGGCLVLEMVLPAEKSFEWPLQVYHPRKPHYPDKKVWKEGKGRYDADTKKHYIDQIIFIEDENGIRQINHSICRNHYERDELTQALREGGFIVNNEYSDRDKTPWEMNEKDWIAEAIKQ